MGTWCDLIISITLLVLKVMSPSIQPVISLSFLGYFHKESCFFVLLVLYLNLIFISKSVWLSGTRTPHLAFIAIPICPYRPKRATRNSQYPMSDEGRLISELLGRYRSHKTLTRPVINSNSTVLVSFGVSLIQILDLDEKNQMLTTLVWKEYVSYFPSFVFQCFHWQQHDKNI